MKEKLIINKVSMIILHTGLSLCTLSFAGAFFYIKNGIADGSVNIYMVKDIIEHLSMSVFLVATLGIFYDIHVKREGKG